MYSILEDIKNIKSGPGEIRSFGWMMGIIMCVLGLYFSYTYKTLYYIPLLFSIAFVIAGVYFPGLLQPLQKTWMAVGSVLGWCTTRIILLLFFYVLLTPFAWVARWCGKRFLVIRADRTAESYWKVRPLQERAKEDLEKQF